jgi:pantoate ligase / CMP/dCMP kinase
MLSFETILGLRCYLDAAPNSAIASLASPTIGFVPTMGALHQGHRSLIDRARQENDIVIVSIFVNPLQFAPGEDLDKYPRQLAADRQVCNEAGVDAIFIPTSNSLQLTTDLTQVLPSNSLTNGLCGKSRPGHFTGVATIVTKLLQIVHPTNTYLGQKDAQQVAIIRKLVQDLHLPGRIVTCPIVRSSSGLALSSRNQYLSPEQQQQAAAIYGSLQQAQELFLQGERQADNLLNAVKSQIQTHPAVQVEYLELVEPETLVNLTTIAASGLLAIAARVGNTRLIDNLLLTQKSPIIAIDGPAGAGKSTVTKLVAQTLGLQFLDTGAMYRAVTWLVLQAQLPLDSAAEIAELVAKSHIELRGSQVLIDGEDVSTAIRSLEVTSKVSVIAALGSVRTALVQQQQSIGRNGGIVAEGRDMCTHVFPDAGVKIFLTATVGERASRRLADLHASGEMDISLSELETMIAERDYLDSTREIAPLKKAATATEIVTDGMSIEQVVAAIVQMYRDYLPA